MHSLRHIKFTIIALIVTLSSYSQSSVSNKEFIDSPYRSEHNPWFEFKVYKRGYKKLYQESVLPATKGCDFDFLN